MKLQFPFLAFLAFLSIIAFSPFSSVASEFVPLFNGKDLSGWVCRGGDASLGIREQSMVAPSGASDDVVLATEKKYENFVLRYRVKIDDSSATSGPAVAPVEVKKETGKAYYRFRLTPDSLEPSEFEAIRQAFKPREWNDITVRCIGPSRKIWINGQPVVDQLSGSVRKGFIGVQPRGESGTRTCWKDIQIKTLPDTPWIELMDDKEMSKLEIKPAGNWEMDDEKVVHGTSNRGENRDGLLLTKVDYESFVAKISFKQIKGNSGLYFAAVPNDQPYWVNGIQGEIDELKTGAIWEVAGRGWISSKPQDLEPLIEKHFKANQWNDFAVVRVGDRIATFLNGAKISEIVDPKTAKKGKIGLQLHGGSDMEYYFKNFAIIPLDEHTVKEIEE